MAASNKRREDEGIAMFDVVEFDGPGVGACATTSATTRHNSTAISVGGDVFVPAHVHTCICICIRVPRGRANGRPVERRRRGEEKREKRKGEGWPSTAILLLLLIVPLYPLLTNCVLFYYTNSFTNLYL